MTSPDELKRKNLKVLVTVLSAVFIMVGVSFASVPLYNLFCRVTGFGGTTQVAQDLPDHVLDRTVTVKLNSDTASNLPWQFEPDMREIDLQIGQKGFVSFHAENKTDVPITGTALYNVVPTKAGKYFHKVQCFCFGEQLLEPKQRVAMPVMFYVSPDIADDPNMDDVKTITLSYTFFKAESEALDQALEAFYNGTQ
ncbi:MAG: cytochrome c oxidase assembly protein [Alphaproteobacteria bacterium]|nr:cytochrome c oxidase assembly protein [Alphaproteobacteria bacterium]MDP7222297.1 cytochrome c oxidase assembly protein [Alphaproteobacteria bacterium]